MASRKINNFAWKGEDYFLSQITTLDKVETVNSPWVFSYFFEKLSSVFILRYMKSAYKNDWPFFVIILWTKIVLLMTVFLVLPNAVLTIFSILLHTLLYSVLPGLLCFLVYLWIGMILKNQSLFFSVRLCFISCIILEVLIELFVSTGLESTANSFVIGTTLLFIVMSTGYYTMDKKYFNTSALVGSIIFARFVVVVNVTTLYYHAMSSLLTYMCIVGGLAVSSLPYLRIPAFNEEDSNDNDSPSFDMSTIPIIRQRRASSVEIPTINQNGAVNAQMKTRRKSLPVLGLPTRKVSMSTMDLTILGEAHGMISDLLADSSLPLNVTGTLRIVADMISPLLQHSFHRNQSMPPSLLTVFEKQSKEDEQQVINQPDLKDVVPLSLKQRLQRNLGGNSRRMSSSYTTTTSATGMPTIDMEYHAKKSASTSSASGKCSTKRTSYRSKSYAGVFSTSDRTKAFTNKSHSFSTSTTRNSPTASPSSSKKLDSISGEDDIFKVEITRGKPVYFEGMDTDSEDEEFSSPETSSRTGKENVKPIIEVVNNIEITTNDSRKLIKKLSSLSEQIEEANSDNSDVADSMSQVDSVNQPVVTVEIENNKPLDNSLNKNVSSSNELNSEESVKVNTDSTTASRTVPPLAQRNVNLNVAEVAPVRKTSVDESNTTFPQESLSIPANTARRRSSRELHLEYEMAVSQEIVGLLMNLNQWDFPIFELSEKCNVLTQLAFRIFQVCGFFTTFKIPETTFLKYFRALESGYHNIPYHNRIHAADVLHGVYYLTQHKIPSFNSTLSRRSSVTDNTDLSNSSFDDEYTYGCMSDVMPELELMALYTAASMHDFDHPGRTNAFLVATLNPKALLYNDRSVLENHHAAAAWSLLVTNPGLNFLSSLDPADFKRFRFIVIEEILSTDLKRHFDFLTEWNSKISEQGGGLNFSSESDRLLVGEMAIKLADISGPSKEWNLHYRWTDRIIEEFYQQGEDEKTLDMPLSAYMDRNDPKVPQLQASFIKHLVSPLYMAYEKAGTMPGEWVDSDSDDEDSANVSDDETSDSETGKAVNAKKKTVFSIVIDNIQTNHQKWLRIIEEEGETQENNELTAHKSSDEETNEQASSETPGGNSTEKAD